MVTTIVLLALAVVLIWLFAGVVILLIGLTNGEILTVIDSLITVTLWPFVGAIFIFDIVRRYMENRR